MSGADNTANLSLRLVNGSPVDGDGSVVPVPAGWQLLQPGDAGLTRRVKKQGRFWLLQEKKGRRVFSQGILAPAVVIEEQRAILERERNSDTYQKRLKAQQHRRQKQQEEYVEEFRECVLAFLDFDQQFSDLAEKLAEAVTRHTTPVGSGTVGRTSRIPISSRASAAVVAWLRHSTTSYDRMSIARVKGQRRLVRKILAQKSHDLLDGYRQGRPPRPDCPLLRALQVQEPPEAE